MKAYSSHHKEVKWKNQKFKDIFSCTFKIDKTCLKTFLTKERILQKFEQENIHNQHYNLSGKNGALETDNFVEP